MNPTPDNPWKSLPAGPLIAPSLLSVDFARAGEQIDEVLAAGAEVLHVDVMDGHFVPNLSMGPPVVRSLRKYTDAPLDVHLMVSDPGAFLDPFADAGASSLNFHIEACGRYGTGQVDEARKLIERIRTRGLGAAVTLKPQTPPEAVFPLLGEVDMVLIMTVEPGFGGQKFMTDQLPKIRALRQKGRPGLRLEVDGGINPKTGPECAAAGADVFVAGHDIFGSPEPARAVVELRGAVALA